MFNSLNNAQPTMLLCSLMPDVAAGARAEEAVQHPPEEDSGLLLGKLDSDSRQQDERHLNADVVLKAVAFSKHFLSPKMAGLSPKDEGNQTQNLKLRIQF